jgi:uncharacterized protein (TIGR02598 family)
MSWKKRCSAGFSLVEVTLALGVAGFCLISVFALLPIGVKSNQTAFSQTAAATILSDVMADIRAATTANSAAVVSPLYTINIPAKGSSNATAQHRYFDSEGVANTALQGNSRYRLAITFPAGTYATLADIKISWPAAVDPTVATNKPAGTVETVAAFSRP